MQSATICLEVDADIGRAFAAASAEEQRKLQLLLNLRLRELIARPARQLNEIMDEIGHKAESCGLTPGILNSLLRDG
jgi:hypothetical protein